jgi:hypothetical protein
MTGALAALVLWYAAPAAAQTWTERGYVSVNGAFQATANDFSDRFEFEKDLETGSTDVDYRVKGGVVFDAGGGVRLWKSLGAGVAVSYFTRKDPAATSTQSPHPFFMNQFRDVSGDTGDLARSETAVHVQAMYFLNPSGPLRLVFSGGPSFFSVEQELVSTVVLTETYPFDTAAFSTVRTEKVKKTAAAFNVGADVMWMLTRSIGVGGILRFSRASVDLGAANNRTVSVDAGGFYGGGGLRVVF